jgi:hypothetical protein
LAVAPVGSVLPAVAVGADFEAVEDLAAVIAVEAAGAVEAGGAAEAAAGVAGVAATAGAVAPEAGLLFEGFCTPPWPLHAPRPVAVVEVPSLQVAGAPAAAGAEEAGAAAGAAAAGAAAAAFCTPPWPLHAPRPVAVEVVPSLQVVAAAVSAAAVCIPRANTVKDTASILARFVFFMDLLPGLIPIRL